MKMNKKGFTLIELLAVIVILAVVALVATPIILASVENAKKQAAIASANNVITAINYNEQMVNFDASTIVGQYTTARASQTTGEGSNAVTTLTDKVSLDSLNNSSVEYSGDKPSFVDLTFDSNYVVKSGKINISGYCVAVINGKAVNSETVNETVYTTTKGDCPAAAQNNG